MNSLATKLLSKNHLLFSFLKHGDAAGVFKVTRGRGTARPKALVSSAGKKEMTNTFRSLVGEKHAPRDELVAGSSPICAALRTRLNCAAPVMSEV